ncbi:dolichol kinase isoform X1 [Leptinotarsa decemlineata]|uniref:dolichol kinase isoform X1 n=1 Tax=Leptinotarsa decemlineata TaxID=7539 RepID=UPI003D30D0F7
MTDFIIINDMKVRPGADSGLWALFLLPLSIIISTFKHPITSTPTYKLASLVCFGILLTSTIIVVHKLKEQKLTVFSLWTVLASAISSTVFFICFNKGLFFALLSGVCCTFLYLKTYKFILEKFKECFTLGEAGIASQAAIILLYFTILNFLSHGTRAEPFKSNMQISTLIIQLGFLGIAVIAWASYFFSLKSSKPFYSVVIFTIVFVIFLPLHILLERSPVLWIFQQLCYDWSTIKLMIYWVLCTGLAVWAINKQIFSVHKASTGTRKIFHLLAVIVYIPGLLHRCSILYLASGVVTGLFFALEILRILQMPPFGRHLQDGFLAFSDEKDVGNLALTPIYLIVGCSLPIWIHPSPCDVTDSSIFCLIPLMSGLLSIGVGDTAASIVGSNYGKHFWPGTKKTFEGTVGCMLAQMGLVYFLIVFNFVPNFSTEQCLKIFLAIFVTSLVEAKTTQVDNLVLPLIMYIILV